DSLSGWASPVTAGKVPILMLRGFASLKSNQRPPLPAPFWVICTGSQNLVLSSASGSVLIHIESDPLQPSFLNGVLPFAGKKTRPLSGSTSTASSAPPALPLPGAIRNAFSEKPFSTTYVPFSDL